MSGSYKYEDIEVIANFDLSEEETIGYIKHIEDKESGLDDVQSITLTLDGDDVKIDYTVIKPKFDRIRRITGYLAGTLDRFNDAKQAEVRDREKHL